MKRSVSVAIGVLALGFVSAAVATPIQSTHGSLFDPNLGNSPGGLTIDPGSSSVTVTFDTDTLTVTAPGHDFSGHSFDLLRSENYGTGNGVELAAFTFDTVALGGGSGSVTVNVQGNRGLVLASMKFMTIEPNVTFNLNGSQGVDQGSSSGWSAGGIGGPGAEGGPRLSYDSNPPGTSRGRGGNGYDGGNPRNGTGYGGGQAGSSKAGGSGGGYGGAGGAGEGSFGQVGQVYPGTDETLATLYGGSGGAGGRGEHSVDVEAGGGGGGGAVQLVARAAIVFKGTINANGGRGGNADSVGTIQVASGGGGSGGAVLIGADVLDFTGTINANGGRGGYDRRDGSYAGSYYSFYQGGAGGGGRIAFYYDGIAPGSSFANVSANGGAGRADGGEDGDDGTIWYSGDSGVGFPYGIPAGTMLVIQ